MTAQQRILKFLKNKKPKIKNNPQGKTPGLRCCSLTKKIKKSDNYITILSIAY